MRRRIRVLICLLLAVFLPAASGAQQRKKARGYGIYRLSSATAASESTVPRLFGWLWGDLGYIEGQNPPRSTATAEREEIVRELSGQKETCVSQV
jgi:hypothetical protein